MFVGKLMNALLKRWFKLILCLFFFQLYEALHVGEHQIIKERQLNEKLETLKLELGPLEEVSEPTNI
jgi:hypothetical protein